MAESLSGKQQRFSLKFAQLVVYANSVGYTTVYNETGRSNEQAEINAMGSGGRDRLADLIRKDFPALASAIRDNGKNNGVRHSVHQLKLAGDLLLFKNGIYLTRSEDYGPLGSWWEQQDPDARWGGHWGDGNHFSFEHEGVK